MSTQVKTVSGFCITLPENAMFSMNSNFNRIYCNSNITHYEDDMRYMICPELVEYIYVNFLNKLKEDYDKKLQEEHFNVDLNLNIYPDVAYDENVAWYLFLATVPDFPNINSLLYLNDVFNSDVKIIYEFIHFLKTLLPELINPTIKYGTIWYYL